MLWTTVGEEGGAANSGMVISVTRQIHLLSLRHVRQGVVAIVDILYPVMMISAATNLPAEILPLQQHQTQQLTFPTFR